ncbi:MAG TPA: hypothetical protein VGJ80_14560 [Gemmatimonadales bacterium]|jgi:alpha-tubulin suppressor-like RCC1 family protein
MRAAWILGVAIVAACQSSESVEIPPSVDAAFSSVTAGLLHTCGQTTTHHVYCWGWNRDGEIGDGSRTNRPYAKQLASSLTFNVVSIGGAHSCAVSMAADAYCWGLNLTGQIGDGSTVSRPIPMAVAGGLSFVPVANGGTFTCGLTSDSSAYCWGWGRDGELGSRPAETCPTSQGPEPCSRTPLAVGGGLHFIAISAGSRHVCGLAVDSTAYCWGRNAAGQLGDGTTADTALPVAVSGARKFAMLALGFEHSCGLTAGGNAYCWGDNSLGQLGGPDTSQALEPMAVSGGIVFLSISAGGEHTCGVGTDHTAHCWGQNASGQLGAASSETCFVGNLAGSCSHQPLPVTTGQIFASISAGGHHTCAITTDGKAYCWGDNVYGQLGTGNTTGRNVPVVVANQP